MERLRHICIVAKRSFDDEGTLRSIPRDLRWQSRLANVILLIVIGSVVAHMEAHIERVAAICRGLAVICRGLAAICRGLAAICRLAATCHRRGGTAVT